MTSDEVQVDGRAGTDLVHLVAELLDNAAAFSPPAAPVVVTDAVDGDGYRIQVTDRHRAPSRDGPLGPRRGPRPAGLTPPAP